MNIYCNQFFFFFQAEDGIRDFHVTGVQTCALPISSTSLSERPVRSVSTATPRLILGCPLWAEPAWCGALYSSGADADRRLHEYGQVFGAVEGNTTFYALPERDTVRSWAELLPADFHFCAKLPREISHADVLDPQHPLLTRFF